jgi:hypothetical protein
MRSHGSGELKRKRKKKELQWMKDKMLWKTEEKGCLERLPELRRQFPEMTLITVTQVPCSCE